MTHDETRSEILRKARGLFAVQGVRKTTLDDIAGAMHRTKTFIYHYFRNKDDLLGALVETEGDEYVEELRKAIGAMPGAKERFRAYILARFSIFSRLGTYYQALREQYFEQYAFIENARAKYDLFETGTMAGILDQGVREGVFRIADPEMVAHAILIALKGFEVEWATQDQEGFERKIDALLSILFDGIAARSGR
ncbi:MAG TPA: TetR/AcrR family transcriptional regulator [Rectinemataceae bacterium]|nr:TetR/AcrR family transcriptional regulator [Rectinemataceae bacterium]